MANLDMAGNPGVVVGGAAYRFDGELYWTINAPGRWNFSAVGNLDDDAYPEVVYVNVGNIYVIEHDGTVKWHITPTGFGYGGPPTIADFDGDGAPEIGIASQYIYAVFEADGSLKWSVPVQDASSGCTGSSVFDFDGDGRAEVVYADEVNLYIFDGPTGEILFQHGVGSGTLIELPLIVDVDNDNNAEIVAVSTYLGTEAPGIVVFGDAADTWLNTRKIWNQHTYHITNVNDDATIPAIEANNLETYNNYRQNAMDNPYGCMDLSVSYFRVDQTNYPESVNIMARAGNGGV